jgi:hypothetical protein
LRHLNFSNDQHPTPTYRKFKALRQKAMPSLLWPFFALSAATVSFHTASIGKTCGFVKCNGPGPMTNDLYAYAS